MSLRTDRALFETAYAARSDKKMREEHDRTAEDVVVVAASTEHEDAIAGLFDNVVAHQRVAIWDSPPRVQPGLLTGTYKGSTISVVHTGVTPGAFGACYMDLVLDRLRETGARNVAVIGELSSLQERVKVGELVVATSAVRADDSHLSYASLDVPAVAHAAMSRALETAARATGRATHTGTCWSCGLGAGIYDACVGKHALALARAGVLGNAVEAATAYLLGAILGSRVGSLWLVADSLYEPIRWRRASPRLDWDEGWRELSRAALDALAALRAEARVADRGGEAGHASRS